MDQARLRGWYPVAALVIVLVSLLPPFGYYARQYVFLEALQFMLFATVVPALVVLGAPWRRLGLARPLGRLMSWRERRPAFIRAAIVLAVFIGASIGWRLPAAVNALARQPAWAVAELACMLVAGAALWFELVDSPPMLARLTLPLRAVFATVAMWSIWVQAYILGFSGADWFRGYTHGSLGAVMDQEIATGVMWAVAAICFVPVVFVMALRWLADSDDPDAELRKVVDEQRRRGGHPAWPRPPRGWRAPPA